ncbi:hypothetical protein GTA07_29985 [Rhodococcus hoagii]|nr:hypothetical protein [Prescottella equi]
MAESGGAAPAPPPQDPEQLAQFERATSLFAKRQTELAVQLKDLRRQRIESAVGIFKNYLEAERNMVACSMTVPTWRAPAMRQNSGGHWQMSGAT